MNISIAEQIKLHTIPQITFSEETMQVSLSDGRILSIPLAWYPSLARATKEQLEVCELSPSGYGVNWPELDEDLSVLGFLFPNRA